MRNDSDERAFPGLMQSGSASPLYLGMSLRDYFATKALQAILPVADDTEKRRGNNGVQAKADDYAGIAYVIADAMLKARQP